MKVLSFRNTKQTSKNIADTTFKDMRMRSLGTLVPQKPSECFTCFTQQGITSLRTHEEVFCEYSDLISHIQTKTQHTQRLID